MFATLGRLTTTRPWTVIGVWIAVAVVVFLTAPGLTSTTDQSEFLPDSYESIKAETLRADAFPASTTPGAILVFTREDGGQLTDADQSKVASIAEELSGELGEKTFEPPVLAVGPSGEPNVSADGLVQIAVAGLAENSAGYDQQSMDDAEKMRDDLADLVDGTGLEVQTMGPAPSSLDSQEASTQTMEIVGAATVVLIVLLLALIFRSVIICLLPIVVVALVSTVATGLIGVANEAFDLKADSSVQVILIVVLYGIGTDYILFLLFRYRERLRQGADAKAAVQYAMERAGEAIASAGGAVIVAFMALVLSSLGIFRAIGPALAIAVAVTLLAALTLVPSIVSLLGTKLFWPSKAWGKEPTSSRFAAIGRALGRRPAAFAAGAGIILAALGTFAFAFNPSFDFNSSLPDGVESTEATETFQEHFAAGASDPTPILLRADAGGAIDESALPAFQDALSGAHGVSQAYPGQVSEDGSAALFQVILDHDPMSDEAMDDVEGSIRDTAHEAAPAGTTAYVGGTASVFVDLQQAMARDYSVVFPVAAVLIMIILALLLRSLVAPWYLMAAVGLGFAATLGATVIVFQNIQGEAGLIFMLPIYIYLFVTALGTDYNILMVARLREEAREGRDPHAAAAEAVKHAGPTIAAAGIILAGTFGALMLGGNTLIVSMGFALSVGILVAAFVMAMFFTPSLTALIGHAAWWPGHGDETAEQHDARVGHHPSD